MYITSIMHNHIDLMYMPISIHATAAELYFLYSYSFTT